MTLNRKDYSKVNFRINVGKNDTLIKVNDKLLNSIKQYCEDNKYILVINNSTACILTPMIEPYFLDLSLIRLVTCIGVQFGGWDYVYNFTDEGLSCVRHDEWAPNSEHEGTKSYENLAQEWVENYIAYSYHLYLESDKFKAWFRTKVDEFSDRLRDLALESFAEAAAITRRDTELWVEFQESFTSFKK